ncbi:MerR family transcriptional regulator [Zavarzinella formosa]|uniref:hypothetical protein n=1 Tax=Zavarzinella formosa TaxID=360055 RepID=UPI000306DFA6|nr:hypothetical protein [Zavarzinella formosa]
MSSATVDEQRVVIGSLSPQDVATRCGNVSLKAVNRWLNSGVLVGSRRVKLRSLKIGGRHHITEADLSEFVAAQNPGRASDAPVPKVRERKKRLREAVAQLRELGVNLPGKKEEAA